jgi:prefoldin subunit 5
MQQEKTQFCDSFKKYLNVYQSGENGVVNPESFNEVSEFINQLLQKLEEDNQWFEKNIADNQEELRQSQQSFMVVQQVMSSNQTLFEQVEDIVHGGKGTI